MEAILERLNTVSSSVLAVVVLLGVIIFVHEAGHLLVAKAFGVRVLTFSLGFGRRLWGFERKGTDYRVSLIPLGGYVKMSGEMPGEETGDPADFLNKPRWQRFLVYLAGPAMNAVLAVSIIWVLFMVGASLPALPDLPSEVGVVEEGSPAAEAGIRRGDVILEIDGEPVELWARVLALMTTADGRPVELQVARGEEALSFTVTPRALDDSNLSDTAGLYPKQLLGVTELQPGRPAEKAGFKTGDQLRAVNGKPVLGSSEFIAAIQAHPEQEVRIDIFRDGREMALSVVPLSVDGLGKIGMGVGVFQRYAPWPALVQSVRFNVQILSDTLFVLRNVVTRRISAENALSGPLEIARISGEAARRSLKDFVFLTALISISIGFLNLLPIPVLDGGQMLILSIESLMRRDLSLRLKEVVTQVGFVFIVLLMLTVIGLDLKKLF